MPARESKKNQPAAMPDAPLTVALIDMGSHNVKMEIYQIEGGSKFHLLEHLEQPLEIGMEVFSSGVISPEMTATTAGILKDFSTKLQEYQVTHLRTFATSAVREAVNRDIFLDNLKNASGITINLLDPTNEAALMTTAVKKRWWKKQPAAKTNFLLLGVGTGSLEVALIQHGIVKFAESFGIGTMRMLDEFATPQATAEQLSQLIESHADQIAVRLQNFRENSAEKIELVAIGESVRQLAALDNRKLSGLKRISLKRFDELYTILNKNSAETLAAKYRIGDVLARSLSPTFWLLRHFLQITGSDELLAAPTTTREAVLDDMLREIRKEPDPFIPDMLSAIQAIAEKYDYNAGHTQAVREVSMKVFDLLQPYHLLGERERLYLESAAYLHDTGRFIDSRQHHRHSYYLIANTQLPGFSNDERLIVATLALYHRKSKPHIDHPEFSMLPARQRIVVMRLAAILRVADAVDYSQEKLLTDCTVSLKKQILEIRIGSYANLTIERSYLRKRSDLFEEVYGLKVSLR